MKLKATIAADRMLDVALRRRAWIETPPEHKYKIAILGRPPQEGVD